MNQDMQEVWKIVREKVKAKVTGRTLYQALDRLTMVTMEGDLVVLGLPSDSIQFVGHINNPTVRNLIEQYFAEAYGFRPQIELIEGTTPSDWQLHLRKQEELRKLSEQGARKREQETRTYNTWEAVYEQLGRKFAETPGRSLAINRARYLQEAIQMVREALARIPVETEADERQLNRVIERVANNAEAPPVLVAWLILYDRSDES